MWFTMKKSAVVAAAAVLVLYGSGAQAAPVEVKVPFPFLVHGQTMPAGRYLLEPDGTDVVLIRGENGRRASIFVMTMPAAGHDPAGDTPALTFARYETPYQLSGIWESGTVGRTIVGR